MTEEEAKKFQAILKEQERQRAEKANGEHSKDWSSQPENNWNDWKSTSDGSTSDGWNKNQGWKDWEDKQSARQDWDQKDESKDSRWGSNGASASSNSWNGRSSTWDGNSWNSQAGADSQSEPQGTPIKVDVGRSQSWSAGQNDEHWQQEDWDYGKNRRSKENSKENWTPEEWDAWKDKKRQKYGDDWEDRRKHKREEKKERKERKGPPCPDRLHGNNWEAPSEEVGLVLVKDMAPMFNWQYPFYDDSRRSYAGHLRNPWTPQRCNQFFEIIKEGTEWLQPTTDRGIMPRKTAWMVKQGCSCSYRYGPFEVPAAEYKPWMVNLLGEVMPFCGIDNPDDWPDSCNMNLYEDGGSAVGWHSDDEMLFQGKFRDILIISLSFGVTRKFELRYNWPEAGEDVVKCVRLASGDLMTMEGMTQKHMQHRVPKEDNIQGPRINLTWRWVLKHSPRCPAGRYRR